ncbi:MAG: hypothetical protein IH621_05220 [Krumholzibacteria bacterium]|nr:hypothetical protein [Candidatus Krumholzibacteria bacterium]
MRVFVICLAAAGLALAGGCQDDSTGPDDRFVLTVRAVDHEGLPVPDLELQVMMDSSWYQDGRAAAKARTEIRWDQPVAAPVTVTVLDVAGGLVRTLFADTVEAGRHGLIWNGEDESGVHQASGLYYARLVARDASGAVVHDQSQPMYMGLMDFRRMTAGVTDAGGEIVLTDKRLFPLLYGQVEMDAVDETGQVMGPFPLVHLMRFYLRDPRYDHVERFDHEVLHSGQALVLDWMGVDAPAAAGPTFAAALTDTTNPEPPGDGYRLYPPYPNPFN